MIFYGVVIGLSLALVLTCYLKICLYDNSWVNGFTIPVANITVTAYSLEFIRLLAADSPGYSDFALVFVFTLIPAYFCSMMLGYVWVRTAPLRLVRGGPGGNARGVAYLLLALGWLSFAPLLITFAPYITSPRAIYEELKLTNLGTFFYVSSVLVRLSLICFLTVPDRSRLETCVFGFLASANIVLHGSQAQMLSVIAIFLFMRVHYQRRRIGFSSLIGAAVGGGVLVIVFMTYLQNPAFLERQLLPDPQAMRQALITLSGYGDYVYNTAHLTDLGLKPSLGAVTMADNLYGRIPRILWPDKPQVFGLMSVSATVRPFAYISGYFPAFIFGEEVADFGVFAIPVVALEGLLAGILMKSCRTSLRQSPSIFPAVVWLYYAGGTLFSIGLGSTLFEQFLCAALAGALARVRVFAPRRQALPAQAPYEPA